MRTAAIYARVSSEKQKEEGTIGSQLAELGEFASEKGWLVPQEWIFADEGYSGKTLVRPGLEKLRDLASEGQLECLLIHAPDRLSRKYAYQVLLSEEFSRHGVEVVFLRAPQATTPEEHLLVQFQGMIAEYERAQIAERSRRGKRYRAKSGTVNVLSGAPYGYRYVKKTVTANASYEVIPSEAAVVGKVFSLYTQSYLSINAIARWLTEQGVPTRTGKSRWDRSVIWAMLRNPAYKGTACFGKTEQVERQKITRPLRLRGGFSPRCSANRERPREQWIEIPVPALIPEETYLLAQELLEKNQKFSPRRTMEPSLLQGLLVCGECGYAFYRTSTRTSKRKIYYYRCLGSDAYRHANGAVCHNRPIRQDYLDALIWEQIVALMENPELIEGEIQRRMKKARDSNPSKRRKENLANELRRARKGLANLLNGYQEDLMKLEELRERITPLRKRETLLQAELSSVEAAAANQQTFLQLVSCLKSKPVS
ncbi:MAG: recombinase family protein [Gammaproteobacteria bacterium]|nr:recombinase family protein [Gammaproteobacteria bacterium]